MPLHLSETFENRWAHFLFQFRVLYRVFFLRVIDLELLSSHGDPTRLMGQFATVFATISFFSSFPVPFLIVGRKPIAIPLAYMFEHYLIETTMTIAGLITVLSWDSAFPDRRDVLVLGPLPVRPGTFFLAKIAALFAAPAIAMASFNLFTGLSWPLVFAVGLGSDFSLLRTLPVYWFSVFGGGAFFVFTVLAIQGLAANLFPRQLFLRLSAILQAAALCLLLSAYFLSPSLNSPAALAAPENQRILQWLPAYWFLGLFNQLNGGVHPELAPLAHRAWIALALSALGALAALLLSYFRTLPRIVEQPDILPAAPSRFFSFGNSLASVITLFSLRTLLRSRQHRMILSFYVGLGLTIILGFVRMNFVAAAPAQSGIDTTFLLASILAVSLTILALRVVISIPITLRANWIFRATQVSPAQRYHRAARIAFFAIGVTPVLLALSGGLFADYPWQQVLAHLTLMALLGLLILELCLYTFRKIPFACSYLPGKANLHFVFWVALFASISWLKDAAVFEGRILSYPDDLIRVVLVLVAAAILLRWLTNMQARQAKDLIFEEESHPEIVSLELNR
jgi:hypothetical protein